MTDALIASLAVVAIGAAAFIVAAWATARSRIGALPVATGHDASDLSHGRSDLPESAKENRGVGWIVVMLLYLLAVFCLLQGLNDLRVVHHWDQWAAVFGSVLSAPAEIALYAEFWIATAIVLCLIGYWAQRRLRRRA